MASSIQAALSDIVQNVQAQLKEISSRPDFSQINQADLKEFESLFETALGEVGDVPAVTAMMESGERALNSQRASVSAESYLLDEPWASRAHKPNVREFMDATGADVKTASELLSTASTGAGDYRDWQKIMESSDPLAAARQATGQFYNSDLNYMLPGYETSIVLEDRVLAKTQNFAIYKKPATDDFDLIVTAKNGLRLEVLPADAPAIRSVVEKYGFNSGEISQLATTMEGLDTDFAMEMRTSFSF